MRIRVGIADSPLVELSDSPLEGGIKYTIISGIIPTLVRADKDNATFCFSL
jgi:hypothetical protein